MAGRIGGVGLLAFLLLFFSCSRGSPPQLGVTEGRLQPCPSSPNCVSSQAPPEDTGHHVEPLAYAGSQEAAQKRLIRVLEEMPRTKLITRTEGYLRAEVTTGLLRFVDDVEFYFEGQLIHCRSASRVGYSDFGANRRRIETVRQRFLESGE